MATRKSLSDLSFDFGESGELELKGFEDDDVFEEEEELDEDEEQEEVEEDEEEEEEVEEEVPDLAARVNGIEKTLLALPQMISTSIASALGGRRQAREEEEEEEIAEDEELNSKKIVNILARRMEKAVKSEVGSAVKSLADTDPAMKEARVTAEFRQAHLKYGQKFVDRMIPVAQIIQRVEKAGGKISAEDAYLSIKDMPAPTKPGQKQATTKKAVRVDADSKDAVGEVPARPKFNSKKMKEMSDADVFQQSWNTSLLSATRAGKRKSG